MRLWSLRPPRPDGIATKPVRPRKPRCMRVILKPGLIALSAETDEEREALAQFGAVNEDHVFHLPAGHGKGLALYDLGPRADACAEPINITSEMRDVMWRAIGNLAHTPFVLRGEACASVEGFWQSLKFDDGPDRERVRGLFGKAAKAAGYDLPTADSFIYDGHRVLTGSPEHRALMLEACRAKFAQNVEARDALLSTGDRPLAHRVRRDSVTIPGVVLSDYWMRIRKSLRGAPLS